MRLSHLSLSSFMCSTFNSLRRSLKIFFFFSLSVCLLGPVCVCRAGATTRVGWNSYVNRRSSTGPQKWAKGHLVPCEAQVGQDHLLAGVIVGLLLRLFVLFSGLLLLVNKHFGNEPFQAKKSLKNKTTWSYMIDKPLRFFSFWMDIQLRFSAVLSPSQPWSSSAQLSPTCASPAVGHRSSKIQQKKRKHTVKRWYRDMSVHSEKIWGRTIRSVRLSSSSSSFFRFSKWASIRVWSSVRSFSMRLRWMSWELLF